MAFRIDPRAALGVAPRAIPVTGCATTRTPWIIGSPILEARPVLLDRCGEAWMAGGRRGGRCRGREATEQQCAADEERDDDAGQSGHGWCLSGVGWMGAGPGVGRHPVALLGQRGLLRRREARTARRRRLAASRFTPGRPVCSDGETDAAFHLA